MWRVGLYTDLNGGMWGNSTKIPVYSSSGGAGVRGMDITPSIGADYFNKDYYVRVRLVNSDGTDYRVDGRRVEGRSPDTFQVVGSTTSGQEAQLANVLSSIENIIRSLQN
jgi:hypothetical protein